MRTRITPPRRHTWDRRRMTAPSAPVGTVSVTGIDFSTESDLIWYFSSEIPSVEGTCPQLQADDGKGGGMRSPETIMEVGGDFIITRYAGMNFEGFCTWQILTAPDGITFADGTLIVPE